MKSRRPCPPGRGPDEERFEERFIDKACASKANRGGCALRGRHRDGIMRTATRHPPVSAPWRGQADLQTLLAGLRNACATMPHRPKQNARLVLVAIGQNLPRKHRQLRERGSCLLLCPVATCWRFVVLSPEPVHSACPLKRHNRPLKLW